MTHLSDLDDDCLLLVLDQLSPEQQFKARLINQRFNQLVIEKMRVNIRQIMLNKPYKNSFTNCRHFSIKRDQILVLGDRFDKTGRGRHLPQLKTEKSVPFLNLLTRFSNTKSFDLGKFNFPKGLLLDVVKRLPNLECIILTNSASDLNEDEWEQIADEIGNRILHLRKYRFHNRQPEAVFLNVVVDKFTNIKHLDWDVQENLTVDMLKIIKNLPKCCWVQINCNQSNEGFEDIIDELNIQYLNWPNFGNRVDRLSILKFYQLLNPNNRCVEFSWLKQLKISNSLNRDRFDCLAASRFLTLEEFSFNASGYLDEDDYCQLFNQMPSVKKLKILFFRPIQPENQQIPQLSIFKLKNLNHIELDIFPMLRSQQDVQFWQSKHFEPVEQYVYGIKSLKMLTVTINRKSCQMNNLGDELVLFLYKLELLKEKQNRVEINLNRLQ